jgi:hypothetical protein
MRHLYRSMANFLEDCFRKQVPPDLKAGLRNGGTSGEWTETVKNVSSWTIFHRQLWLPCIPFSWGLFSWQMEGMSRKSCSHCNKQWIQSGEGIYRFQDAVTLILQVAHNKIFNFEMIIPFVNLGAVNFFLILIDSKYTTLKQVLKSQNYIGIIAFSCFLDQWYSNFFCSHTSRCNFSSTL